MMNPDTPILMITLQIPVTADTNTAQVLEAIAQKVDEALYEIKQQQAEGIEATDLESLSRQEFKESLIDEKAERFTTATRNDLLSDLGYQYHA